MFYKTKNLLISQEVFLVDNSFEISNISLTPRDIIDTHHIMTLVSRNINRESFIY